MATPVNNPSTDDLTEAQKQEYNRWQGYANALLVASTVLFAGTAIAFPKDSRVCPHFVSYIRSSGNRGYSFLLVRT